MKNKKIGFYLHINDNEKQLINDLKNKYCINISKLIKKFLVDYHKKIEKKKNETEDDK